MYLDTVVFAQVVHGLCTVLLTVAVVALWRKTNNAPRARDARLTAVETGLDEAFHRVKVLHGKLSRVATRRGDLDDDEEPAAVAGSTKQRKNETAEQWKARMRLKLRNGGLIHDD